MPFKSVTIKVPASTSNLGSGFDTLGLALDLYNRVRVAQVPGRGVRLASPVAEADRGGALAMIAEASRMFFHRARAPRFAFAVSLEGNLPIARGLGYSATVRLGLVAGLNELAGTGWDRARLLELVTALEGHPDNASPAIFGGFTVSGRVGTGVRCQRFRVSRELKAVTLLPNFKISTERARELLPDTYSRADTAHALNRAALITAAFAGRDYEALRGLFDDRVHQPCRTPLIPALPQVIAAGERAGALGGFLSGSGSAIICLTLRDAEAVGAAMHRQLPASEVRVLTPDNAGFRVEP